MSMLIPRLLELGPKSVKVSRKADFRPHFPSMQCALNPGRGLQVCTLLQKRNARACGFVPQYVGFSVPDLFVVGYNMDYNEAFRELPHVCVINTVGIERFK